MSKSDFTIYCVSNGSLDLYPSNTLSHFTNAFPAELFNVTKNYQVALKSLVFDNKFAMPFPETEVAPSLIFTNKLVGQLSSFEDLSLEEAITLPQCALSFDDLYKFMLHTATEGRVGSGRRPFLTAWHRDEHRLVFGCYTSAKGRPYRNEAGEPGYTLLVHHVLHPVLVDTLHAFTPKEVTSITLQGENYLVYNLQNPNSHFFAARQFVDIPAIPSAYRPLLYVHCNIVNGHFANNTFVHHLATISIPEQRSPEQSCFHVNFEHPVYLDVNKTSLKNLTISLVDVNGHQLLLRSGWATIAQLHFKATHSMMNVTHYVRVTSGGPGITSTDNLSARSHFTVSLGQPIGLYPMHEWRVALTSAHIPMRFRILLHPNDLIFIAKFYASSAAKSTLVNRMTLVFPDTVNSMKELLHFMNEAGSGYMKASVSASTGGLMLTSDYTMVLHFRGPLYHFLGNSMVTAATRIITIKRTPNQPFAFHGAPRFYLHVPQSIFCYCDIIQPQVVAGKRMKVLKIFPVQRVEGGEIYAMLEFKSLDFAHVITDRLETLTFELRSQDGRFINFTNNCPDVVLNLLFSNH